MIIHDYLPLLHECLVDWKKPPSRAEFERRYTEPLSGLVYWDFHSVLSSLNWDMYREETLRLDPARELARVKKHLAAVEKLFGFELGGEIVLFGAFTAMDGYARFDRGTHRVFLGVDESHGRGQYLDILEAHELTHVARESRPWVWEGWGLDPKMPQSDFGELIPVSEHLLNEGFACAVSEILVPCEEKWHYGYQTEDGLRRVLEHGPAVDKVVHGELRKSHDDSNWGVFYDQSAYVPRLPQYSHYVWAWQWAKQLIRDHAGGDPAKLVNRCSRDFLEDALNFKLTRLA